MSQENTKGCSVIDKHSPRVMKEPDVQEAKNT